MIASLSYPTKFDRTHMYGLKYIQFRDGYFRFSAIAIAPYPNKLEVVKNSKICRRKIVHIVALFKL